MKFSTDTNKILCDYIQYCYTLYCKRLMKERNHFDLSHCKIDKMCLFKTPTDIVIYIDLQ